MLRIYIASPYTNGDQAENVRIQIDAANDLMKLGYAPFWPLHSHFLHMVHPHSYETWLAVDFSWILACDAVLRLPGESKGADHEVAFAMENNIPVFFSIDELRL